MKIVKKILLSLSAVAIISTTAIACKSTEKNPMDPNQMHDFPKPPDGNPPPGGPGPKGTPPEKPNGAPPGGFGGDGHANADINYSASVEVTSKKTLKNETYSSTQSDQCALLISTDQEVEIENPTIVKTGSSFGGDSCNFYGLNAALLVKGGSTTTITGGTITSDANGANGVFSYGGNRGMNGESGDGTSVIISNTKITTTGDGSGGIMTAGGGITKASNLEITTKGRSSAPIRSDRGGGLVTVDGGSYTSYGLGSPTIYSTADITVSNATLVSHLSEGVCIEGKNSITLNNSNITANNTDCNSNAGFHDTIMIYQSMSGDADSGTSCFTMNGGNLTSKNGHMFHVTNTNAIINLNGATLINEDSSNILLSVCDDGWFGSSNIATLNASNQKLEGTLLVGNNSTLTLNLTNNSTFKGNISGKITNAKGKKISSKVGNVSVKIDSTSTWTLTGDTYISSLDGDLSQINTNGYKLYVNGKLIKSK